MKSAFTRVNMSISSPRLRKKTISPNRSYIPSSEDITDPEVNIGYGCLYLRSLYDRFGDWELAVAAYNAGPNRVAGWLADSRYSPDGKRLDKIPYDETENYVNRVFSAKEQYEKLYY